MGLLSRLWVAMRTQDLDKAGTDDKLVLIVNEDGIDKLHFTFPDTSQSDQDQGRPNLYQVDVEGKDIHTENLTDSSMRMAIRGADLWHPQSVLLWGVEHPDGPVFPLGLEVDIEKGITTEANKGNTSFPIRLIGTLSTNTKLKQIIVALTTAKGGEAGTDNQVEIELSFAGQKWAHNFGGLKKKEAGLGFFPEFEFDEGPEPTRNTLESVKLRIQGDDAWSPSNFFVFGLENPYFPGVGSRRPGRIIPLVHLPSWELGPLSTNPSEGSETVNLPLAPIPVLV